MAKSAEQQWQFAQRVERELQALVENKGSIYEDVEHLIHQLRIACETTIFLDFDYATQQKVHTHLWDAHISINKRYRKILSGCKSTSERKKVVERRKWEKRYVDFLKTSQFFYKGHIQRLASHFAGLAELRKIAHRLQMDTLSADGRVQVSADTEQRILLSCHANLISLGDLSRYRNATRTKDRSWDMAMAYYGLANDLYPTSGNAFHQMAVISLAEGEHLNAIYHLYRALAIEEPHLAAEGNLEIEFKKIAKDPTSGGRKQVAEKGGSNGTAGNAAHLVSWFTRLHAKIYKGEDFPSHEELENEVLGQMAVLLKRQPLEGILDKIILINIAAQYVAHSKLQATKASSEKEEYLRSFYFCLRLNIRSLIALLQLLESELVAPVDDDDAPDVTGRGKDNTESITAVTRRLLPALRQYSTWLVSSVEIINAKSDDANLYAHIRELWSTYCSTLSLLVVTFPPENLKGIDYLLEEDASTVGMKPFRDSKRCRLYTTAEGRLKPRITDPGVERSHPNLEMLSRVRDLLRDGMVLSNINAPVQLVGIKFQFVEDGLPLEPSSGQSTHSSPTPESAESMAISDTSDLRHNNVDRPASFTRSDSPQSMSTDMYRMVDDLVTPTAGHQHITPQGSNETSYGMHSLTAADIYAAVEVNGRPISRQAHSPAPFPHLPVIYNSPFSPQPGELSTTTSDRPDAAGRLSSLHLSTNQQQRAAANSLDQNTGYTNGQRLSRETQLSSNRSATSIPQQSVSEEIQQSLAERYKLPSSAVFSHPSSLYSGTPVGAYPAGQPYREYSHNTSTSYGRIPDFELSQLLQSSIWNGSQQGWATGSAPTPPNGQS